MIIPFEISEWFNEHISLAQQAAYIHCNAPKQVIRLSLSLCWSSNVTAVKKIY